MIDDILSIVRNKNTIVHKEHVFVTSQGLVSCRLDAQILSLLADDRDTSRVSRRDGNTSFRICLTDKKASSIPFDAKTNTLQQSMGLGRRRRALFAHNTSYQIHNKTEHTIHQSSINTTLSLLRYITTPNEESRCHYIRHFHMFLLRYSHQPSG